MCATNGEILCVMYLKRRQTLWLRSKGVEQEKEVALFVCRLFILSAGIYVT